MNPSLLLLPTTTTYTEEELIASLKNKEEAALSYLYDQYSGALNAVIFNLIKDQMISEDILQESFLKIWNNIAAYDSSKGRLFTWMRTIAYNLTLDKMRSKEYQKSTKISGDESAIVGLKDEENNVIKRINTNDLKVRLNNLDPRQRLVINMSYFEGYTQEQIAAELEMPLGTVKTKIRNAILALRKTFEIN